MTHAEARPRQADLVRVVVIGAGIAGLTAARSLAAGGHEVVVLDKGRSPGGRMATRRIGGATVDHGAQFFTVRGDAFAAQVAVWQADGTSRVWCHGFTAGGDGFPRYIGTRGMNAIAKRIAVGLDVRCGAMAFAVRRASADRDRWDVVVDDGTVHRADAVISTCPLAQTFSLLVEADVDLPRQLVTDDYERTLAFLAVLDGPSAVPSPGGVQGPDGIFAFVADNAAKGISTVPALTFHARPAWSEEHWDRDPAEIHEMLVDAARPWQGSARIVDSQVKRWRFATPRTLWPDPCWIAPERSLVVAGDAFAGPKVEGAFNSGLAAAAALTAS